MPRIATALAAPLALSLAALVACAPATSPADKAADKAADKSAPAVAAADAPTPNPALAENFPQCTWGEVKSAGVSLWAYACPNDRIVADAALPGFKREMSGPSPSSYPIIWLFTKPAGAPVDAALPAIRAASKGSEACVLEQIKDMPAGQFQLMPAGEARKRYDAFIAGKAEEPALPCGPLGPSEAGMRIIREVPGAPTLVAVMETGSDVPLYGLDTIRASR
jgi:hypothetical protein